MAGLNVLVLPSWYATPAHPLAGVFVRDQALAAARRNRVVVVFSEGAAPGVRRLFALSDRAEDGLRVLRVRHRPVALPRAAQALTLAGVAATMSRLRREGFVPDVIHAHTLGAGAAAVVLGRLVGVPVVVSEHWSAFLRGTLTRWERTLARQVFERADLVCPVSEPLQGALAELAPRARFRVVPNPVDTAPFRAVARPRRPPQGVPARLVCVALLADKKGVAQLLEALARRARAGAPSVTLDVVGDGARRDELERRAGDLGIDGVVRFRGLRPRADVARMLGEADLFVAPSLVETFGVALVEALAAELPVVATDVGVASELVDDRVGVLVPPGDPAALAAGIDDALARLGDFDLAAASERVGRRFEAEVVGRAWDAVYEELQQRGEP